jgi:uncharacterized membrane protein YhhN
MSTLLGALVLLGAVGTVFFESRGRRRDMAISKTAASLLFLVLAVYDGWPMTTAGWCIFAGLVFSAAGDVFLLRRERTYFLSGLVAFLVAHLLYSAAFLQNDIDLPVIGVTAAVTLAVSVQVLRWLWPHVPAAMRGPVVAYILAIGAMVVLAAGSTGAGGDPILLAGAVAFFLSDLAVARDRFVRHAIINRMWGLPTYYVAQVLFALSVQ